MRGGKRPTSKQIIGFHTTRLPLQLERELKSNGALSADFTAYKSGPRDQRKNQDKDRKPQQTKKRKPEEGEQQKQRPAKKQKVVKDAIAAPKPAQTASGSKKTPLERLLEQQKGPPISNNAKENPRKGKGKRTAAEEQEDKEIAWLEQQLNAKSSWQDEINDDGLDDLFEDLNRIDKTVLDGDERQFTFNHTEETDEDVESDSDEGSFSEDLSDADDRFATNLARDNEEELKSAKSLTKTEKRSTPQQAKRVHFESPDAEAEAEAPAASTSKATYVPPHLREKVKTTTLSKDSSDLKELKDTRLDRLISGNLNKLSPANIRSIIQTVQNDLIASSTYSRALVSASIVRLILDRTAVAEIQGDVNVMTLAAFVAGVDANGTNIREGIVLESLKLWDAPLSDPESKRKSNIVNFWSKLYNLGTIGCHFVYGIVQELIDGNSQNGLDESSVEQLLILLKNSGVKLRSDDPSALKQIVQLVEEKRKVHAESMGSRAKFMIETLANLKNNKVKNDASSTLQETETSLKKAIKSASSETLQFTPADLRQAGERGKWWRTGAAWAGDALVESKQRLAESTNATSDDVWQKLARKQGMNTDVRRQIFVAIMSADDYVDACERLSLLKFKEVQQREIVKVILHCCSNEKAYNPFYAMVLHRWLTQTSATSHSFVITAQYNLWDFFRKLGEAEVGGTKRLETESSASTEKVSSRQVSNMARLYGWCIGKEAMLLTMLRPVPFATVGKPARIFLRQLLSACLVATQSSSPMEKKAPVLTDKEAVERVFGKAARVPTLAQGLSFFFDAYMTDDYAVASSILRCAKTAMEGRVGGAELFDDNLQ